MKPRNTTAHNFQFTKPDPKEKPFLNEKELAELVGVSYMTIKNWRKNGLIKPTFRTGKRIFYSRSFVNAFMLYGPNISAQALEDTTAQA